MTDSFNTSTTTFDSLSASCAGDDASTLATTAPAATDTPIAAAAASIADAAVHPVADLVADQTAGPVADQIAGPVADQTADPALAPAVEAAVVPAIDAQVAAAGPAFAELGLAPTLLTALARLDIATPTPVQVQAIPVLLAGHDLIASAPTGTGKTAAFMLPALQRLSATERRKGRGPRVLVLTPTRELAQQVTKATQGFSRTLPRLTTVCITGGESYFLQNKQLSAAYEVLVATPGRLMDQMNSGRIDLGRVEMLILDEADRMLDMGFSDDVLAIAQALPADRQTVCFTATVSHAVRGLASRLLRDPQWLVIEREAQDAAPIDEHVIYVDGPEHRQKVLEACLNDSGMGQAIVFTATKRHAEELADQLYRAGIAAQALHGDLSQRDRVRALNKLRRGECKVLVATDVAARGIDVLTVTHVINYALPKCAEDYVHRIGRTGRAGASGQALSFVGREDLFNMNRIEHFIGRHVQVSEFEGLAARFKPEARKARPKSSTRDGRRPGPAKPGGWAKPAHAKTGYGKPAHGSPAHGKPVYDKPAYDKPGHAKPAYAKPAFAKPAYARSDDAGSGNRRTFAK